MQDVRLHWREDGAGPPLLLLNSVGCDQTLWDAAMAYFKGFRVLRMDMRGHGESDSPPGDYTLGQIAADALAVLDAAGVDRAAVCGLSLGGMAAMTLALNAPSRVSALILACTSARMDRQIWDARIATVRAHGMGAIADAVMTRFFSEKFRRDHAEGRGRHPRPVSEAGPGRICGLLRGHSRHEFAGPDCTNCSADSHHRGQRGCRDAV